MPRSEIPEEVLRFIERRIDSVSHLEALLLLWEAPTDSWTDARIGARVYLSTEQARKVLTDLVRSGLIAATSTEPKCYRYDPAWDESRLMTEVAAAHRQHLVPVSKFIHNKAASVAVQEFARAFQLKDKE